MNLRGALITLFLGLSASHAEEGPLLQPLPQGPASPPKQEAPRFDFSNLRRERAQLQADRDSLNRMLTEPVDDYATEAARLRRRLEELLKRLPAQRTAAAQAEPVEMPTLPLPRKLSAEEENQPPVLPKPELIEPRQPRTKPTITPLPEKMEKPTPHPPVRDVHPLRTEGHETPGKEGSEEGGALPTDGMVDPLALGHSLFQTNDFNGALAAYRRVDLTSLKPADRVAVHYMMASCLRKLGKLDEATALYQQVANSKADEMLANCARWQLSSIAWRRNLDREREQMRQQLQSMETKP
jgi:tetratricopeptide (TPR) repeat protein